MSLIKTVRRSISAEDRKLKGTEIVHETGGLVFDDGQYIELARSKTGNLCFLNSTQKIPIESVLYGKENYVPPRIDGSISNALVLPTERGDCGSTNDLFMEIRGLFTDYGISVEVAEYLTFFAFSSWFADLLDVAPCLVLSGPAAEVSLIFRLLHCVVRHGLSVRNLSLRESRHIPMHLQPTLLIANPHHSIYKLLIVSTYSGVPLLAGGSLVDLCSAKVIYIGSNAAESPATEGILHVNIEPCHGKLPMVASSVQRQIAASFQPRLVDYRLKYALRVRSFDFDEPEFPSALRILMWVMGACIVDELQLQNRLYSLLEEQQYSLQAKDWFDPMYVAVEVLFEACHADEAKSRISIGKITDLTNEKLLERGAAVVAPKLIGGNLRSQGFKPWRFSAGFAIELTDDARRHIHKIAYDRCVAGADRFLLPCPHCAELSDAELAELDAAHMSDEE